MPLPFLFQCSRPLFSSSFRDKKLSDCFQLLITKKPVSFDYVAVDATALVATALRLSKHVSTEQRRNKEVARHVAQSLQQFLRKVHCKKSLLIALDGAEGILKAHISRSSALTKKMESRLVRLPGTSLMQAVEERIVRMMPDRQASACQEVVVCGTRVAGSIEEKISAWALDLACQAQHNSNVETLTMLGPTELYLNVLGLTPYFHVSSLVQNGADLRQMRWADMLEWLELSELAGKGESLRVARARTDALFLYMLCNGCTAMDLPAVHGSSFSYLYHRYCELNGYGQSGAEPSGGKRGIASSNSGGGSSSSNAAVCEDVAPTFLFEDVPGNKLRLNLDALQRVFQSTTTRMKEEKDGRMDPAVESYLSHALQAHTVLCLGHNPNPGLLPQYLVSTAVKSSAANTVSTMQLMSHLRAVLKRKSSEADGYRTAAPAAAELDSRAPASMHTSATSGANAVKMIEKETGGKDGAGTPKTTAPAGGGSLTNENNNNNNNNSNKSTLAAFEPHYQYLWSSQQPFTAGEFTLLSYSQAHLVEAGLQLYVGAPPKPELAKRITDERRAESARGLLQEALSFANPAQPHPCLCFSPSYLWEKNPRSGVWTMAYIDVGAHSAEREIRRSCNAISGLSMSLSEGADEGPTFYAHRDRQWTFITQYPLEAKDQVDHNDDDDNKGPAVTRTAEREELPTRATTPTPLAGSPHCEGETEQGEEEDSAALSRKRQVTDEQAGAEVLSRPRTTTTMAARTTTSAEGTTGDGASCSSAVELKVLSWNVMFDRYSGQPTPLGMPGIDWCSPQRYPVLSRCMEREKADVIGLQEVETPFAQFLAEQPWCRDHYILSCPPSSAVLEPWGVMMLIRRGRFTLHQLTHVNVPAWSGHVSLMPIVSLSVGATSSQRRSTSVDLAAVHLIAPFTKANESARTGQDAALRQRAVKGLAPDAIVMGDFNDWPGNEFLMPPDTLYRECWPLVHPDDPGKTMDDSNTFCQLKVEEMFFGRSDKIFLRSRKIQPIEAHLVGVKSVNEENGNKEAPAYLFPSDHYGVSMTFSVPV